MIKKKAEFIPLFLLQYLLNTDKITTKMSKGE